MDIIKGLSFLHRHQIMHLDIKSPNILLTDTWEARIADVGLGKIVAGEGSIATQGTQISFKTVLRRSNNAHGLTAQSARAHS